MERMETTKPLTVTRCSATADPGERLSTVTVLAARSMDVVEMTVLSWMSVERVSETTPLANPEPRLSEADTMVGAESLSVA